MSFAVFFFIIDKKHIGSFDKINIGKNIYIYSFS